MRQIIITALAAALAAFLPLSLRAKETLPAADSKIVYIGRTLASGGEVSFDWSGVYARVSFSGSSLSLRAGDSRHNLYNVWLDRPMSEEPDKIISIQGQDTVINLFTSKELEARYGRGRKALAALKTVTLQKRTEGEQGRTVFKEFTTDGAFAQAPGPKERVIEFIGDSYTCGYGTENSVKTDGFTLESENQNKTYACLAAR